MKAVPAKRKPESASSRHALHGLALPASVLRALQKRGIYCTPGISLEHQHLARRYVLRGVESGGAVSDMGRACAFVSHDGEARQLGDGLGYLKIAMFPGMIGVEVANEISRAVEKLGAVGSLIIDLRGNTGGGIGALRVMSMITPGRVPVGFALDRRRVTANLESEKHSFHRFSRIPSSTKTLWRLALQFGPAMMAKKPIVLQTEGLGEKPFHGRVVLLVNRHTASAAEMVVAFARENQLATIVGEKTAGRLLSATSVKVGNGFRLAMPTGAYYTWNGLVLEGTPMEPDLLIDFNWRERRECVDGQLDHAIESIRGHHAVRVS